MTGIAPAGSLTGRVVVFVKGAGPGGVERIALRLAAGWRAAGIDVAVTSATPGSLPDGCRIAPRWPLIGTGLPMLRLGVALWRDIGQSPPALIFCPGNAYTIVAVLVKLAWGRRCPPIVAKISNDLTRRDMAAPMRPLYRLWLRIQGRAIDHFAALSAPMRDEVVALMRVPRSRVHVVPNPVLGEADPAQDAGLRAAAREGAGRRFVAVGRLERQKDYPAMLRAFAAGAGPLDRLTIYGEGRDRPALEALIGKLMLHDRVRLAGHCPDVRAQLYRHDILLLSSRYEGHPGAVVEALSAGLGVVATRCCAGLAELLDGGALGTLVEAGDAACFARAVARAAPGAQDRERALAKARESTIERAVPAYAVLFAGVLAARAEPERFPFPATIARPA